MNAKHSESANALSKRRLLWRAALPLLLCLCLLAGCAGAGGHDYNGGSATEPGSGDGALSESTDQFYDVDMGMGGGDDFEAGIAARPYGDDVKLIHRASLSLETTEFDETAANLRQLIADCGGYFESSNVDSGSYHTSGYRYGYYIVRIPQENYDKFLNSANQICHVTNCSQSTEDIGLQYYDIESQIRLLTIKQERLLSLLDQATSMEDIIQLENSLSEVQYLLEENANQRNHYDSLISYSTIEISLNQVTRLSDGTPDQRTFGQQLSLALRQGLQSTADSCSSLILLIAYNIIPLTVFFIVLLLLLSSMRRRQSGNTLRGKKPFRGFCQVITKADSQQETPPADGQNKPSEQGTSAGDSSDIPH